MIKRAYIETYGCQMNEADSELLSGLLQQAGYEMTGQDADADVVILNTCAIRERAEERIYGRLGWLKTWKAEHPDGILVVAGCMAQRLKGELTQKTPYLDLVLGPDSYRQLPELLTSVLSKRHPVVETCLSKTELYEGLPVDHKPGISGWISIQRGCNKFCSYCIVPYVRGRERSVKPQEILSQAQRMVEQGFKEITLLGQTVSSYCCDGVRFSDLLYQLNELPGLLRIRFMSPYPTDFDESLCKAMALPKVARHLHLPLQSGSDRMLKAMNRQYTYGEYREIVDRLRASVPDLALTTDVIAGFSGETDEDFEQTLQALREIRFESAFMFRYSERDGTVASRKMPDDVPDAVKGERLERMIALQEAISKEQFEKMVGRTLEVLVDGESRRDPGQIIGRSSCFKTVLFENAGENPPKQGALVQARIVKATSHTLFGELIS